MSRRNTCIGCGHVIAADAPWCSPCGRRMPSRLSQAVLTAQKTLQDAVAAGQEWLRQVSRRWGAGAAPTWWPPRSASAACGWISPRG